MSVRDSTGATKLAEADNGGTGLNSQFTYTATTTGTYFLAAGACFNPNGTGTYKMSLSVVTPPDDSASSTLSLHDALPICTATGNIETVNDSDWFKTTLI